MVTLFQSHGCGPRALGTGSQHDGSSVAYAPNMHLLGRLLFNSADLHY